MSYSKEVRIRLKILKYYGNKITYIVQLCDGDAEARLDFSQILFITSMDIDPFIHIMDS